jgi:hypothetical protein
LNQLAYKLNVAANSAAILRKARLSILNEANKLPPPIDSEMTDLHYEVAAAVPSASGKVEPERPPDLSRMTDNEFREYTRKNFGF